MRALHVRVLHTLKWFPPLWLIAMWWLTWGDAQMSDLGVPLPAIADMPSAVQHLDVVVIVMLFAGALIYRLLYRPRLSRRQAVWAGLAVAFVVLGAFSSWVNMANAFDAAGSVLSLGRNMLYFSALTLLPWGARDERRVFHAAVTLVVVNLLAIAVQWALWIRLHGPGIVEDGGVGAFGFANDAALLNLTCSVGLLLSALPFGGRAWAAAVLLIAGLASAFLTGTAVTLALVPIIWLLARRGEALSLIARAAAGYCVAAAGIYFAFRLVSALMGPAVESYAVQLRSAPPGIVTGSQLIAARITANGVITVMGLGPGRVNSRGAIKSGATVMPELTLPSATGTSPLTYFQMNQSVLVALAEYGWLGVSLLTAFWATLVWQVHLKAVGRAGSPGEDAYNMCRLAAVVVLFFLGFLSLGWNESPFAYCALLTVAPLFG